MPTKPTTIELDMDKLDDILRRVDAKELQVDDFETIRTVIESYVPLLLGGREDHNDHSTAEDAFRREYREDRGGDRRRQGIGTSADAVRRSSIGVTVYVSQTDFALQISGDYRNNRRRLGDANGESVVLEGIDVVDATNAESQDGADFGHTGHMYPFISIEIMQDIVEIIRGLPVDQRSFTSGRVISTIQSH